MAKHSIPATEGERIPFVEGEQKESASDRHEPRGQAEGSTEEREEKKEVEREDCLWCSDPLEHGEAVDGAGNEGCEWGREDSRIAVELCDITPLHQEVEECCQTPCDAHESKTRGGDSPEEEGVDAGGDTSESTHRT